MRVAILHDFIRTIGGTERVLVTLLKIFPKAHIYTLIASHSVIDELSINKVKIITSVINYLPLLNRKNSFNQLVAPLIWNTFALENKYDLIISNSSYGLSNLLCSNNIPHIQYIQSPPKNIFRLSEKWALQKILPYHLVYSKLYKKSVKYSQYILTNSYHMQKFMKKIFDTKSTVIYPPVHIPKNPPPDIPKEYFLYVGRLDKTKSVDLAILACNKLKLPFKIVGEGEELMQLKKIAGPTIEFVGHVPDDHVNTYYEKAIAFLFCAKNEDFGIAPLESVAHGVPVISFYGGGVIETLTNRITGLFFYNHTVDSLIRALKEFNSIKFNQNIIYKYSFKFSEDRFKSEFTTYVSKHLKIKNKNSHNMSILHD